MNLNLGNIGSVGITVTIDVESLIYLFIVLALVGMVWALSFKYIK